MSRLWAIRNLSVDSKTKQVKLFQEAQSCKSGGLILPCLDLEVFTRMVSVNTSLFGSVSVFCFHASSSVVVALNVKGDSWFCLNCGLKILVHLFYTD